MLTVLGAPRRCGDGMTHRERLQAGTLAVLAWPHCRGKIRGSVVSSDHPWGGAAIMPL
jgi:hypothetical protein